jgi:type I restriction enzyme S subunit
MAAKSASPEARQILDEIGVIDLPPDWDTVRVESLLSDDRGIAVGVMYPGDHDPAGIPLIKAGDLGGSRVNPRPEFRITPDKHHEYGRTELTGGELLISLVGDVGRCAVVPPQMAGWNAARAIAVLRFKNPRDAAFVRACMMSSPLQHLMQAWSTTTVQATLNLKEIRQIPLPWPSMQERDAIAHILGTLDDKIELNRRMNETLEAMARALFKSWFVDFDPVRAKAEGRDPGLPKPLADLFPARLVDSEVGEIPEGWRVAPLPEVVDVNPTRALRKGVAAPYLDMANMPTHGHSADDLVNREFGSGMRFIDGDTLVARITPCLENGKTAFVDFLEDGQVGWGSPEYIVLRPKAPLPEEYAYCLARSAEFREFAIQSMTGTSGRQRVPAESLAHFRVAVRPRPIAEAFGRAVKPRFARASAAVRESRTLAALRDALLPKLTSGELRVKDIENAVEATT